MRVLIDETPKKEGFRVHVIRTLSFFRGKSDVFLNEKKKKFHEIRTLQHEGPNFVNHAVFQLKNVHF